MDYFLIMTAFCSIGLNIYLLVKLDKYRFEAESKISEAEKKLAEAISQKKEVFTIDAKQILHDLTNGGALVRITPLDPSQMFYRAPKG